MVVVEPGKWSLDTVRDAVKLCAVGDVVRDTMNLCAVGDAEV